MPLDVLLTFNPGSSTVKLGLFAIDAVTPLAPRALARRTVDAAPDAVHRIAEDALQWARDEAPGARLVAAGHRVVHGGDRFTGAAAIDDDTLAAIEALAPLAPLHQPQSLRLIRAVQKAAPALAQTASFDTAFHSSQCAAARRYALPRALFDQGIKHYGFHGLSYKFIASQLRRLHPAIAAGRVVVAHLGSGASLCGLLAGASRDTSMGFSTLDGVPMATRCGALDPGVLLYLLRQPGQSIESVEDMLYHQAGLLGLSGISGDARALAASDAPEAREALAHFTLRIAREVAAIATTLGGLDALVFTAGIGENRSTVREAVCRHLAWLGVAPEPAAGKVAVLVMHTDEEQVIAEEACALISHSTSNGSSP
ncbi:acetate kinase [Variovorax sp. PAMC 28711]|uniref:acetate kinase n=1 Tax=Variovorax sp. PAMC 28711 TaxID=1795631 RepID=UPI00078DA173|nr:acetate kinase [Variovorax sp. PAMC 28711]AMM26910.1 acetate kinase [Variovorax sp. PAMC 28711]